MVEVLTATLNARKHLELQAEVVKPVSVSLVEAVVPLSLCSFMPLPAAMMLATVVLPTPEGP